MLKRLDTSKAFGNLVNTKCAEVFCQAAENFSIICTFCEMKSFEFGDFVLHFKNVHLQDKGDVQDVIIKSEPEVYNEDDFPMELLQKYEEDPMTTKENDILLDDNEEKSSTKTEDLKSIKDIREESDWSEVEDIFGSDNDEDEDYIPRIFAVSSKKVQTPRLKCEDCNKTYKLSKMLEQHIKKFHSGTQKYKCPRCDRVFEEEYALDKHLQKQHAGFPCAECDKVYKSKEALHIHQFNHTGERKFVCNIENCGKAFFNPKQLCTHKRMVHVATRNFVCETCGFRTKTNSALIVHNRSHTGEKPFICKNCGKGFASQSLLCEHQPIHSTDRPHKCDVCGAAFSRPKALYHHKHLHLDVKKFVCKICDKAYAQAAGLAGHMRQHKSEF